VGLIGAAAGVGSRAAARLSTGHQAAGLSRTARVVGASITRGGGQTLLEGTQRQQGIHRRNSDHGQQQNNGELHFNLNCYLLRNFFDRSKREKF